MASLAPRGMGRMGGMGKVGSAPDASGALLPTGGGCICDMVPILDMPEVRSRAVPLSVAAYESMTAQGLVAVRQN